MISHPARNLLLSSLFVLLAACGGGGSDTGTPPTPPPVPFVDTDKDGVADAQDVAPNDPLCAARSDAVGDVCYVRLLAASRVKVIAQANGKIFFSSEDDAFRLYGYDLKTGHFLGRASISGYTPTTFAYSADHARVYVGDTNGNIHSFSESLQESASIFARVPLRIDGLAAVGKYLMAQDATGAWSSHWVFDKQGVQTDSKDWNYYSTSYEWNQASATLYFFRDDTSPNDLMFEKVNQTTGKLESAGESPYHGAYTIKGPIRSNAAGDKILLGTGDVYAAPGLTWQGNIGVNFSDAAWLANGELITLSTSTGKTRLTRLTATWKKAEEIDLDGEVLAASISGNTNTLIVKKASHIVFVPYIASDDSDGDGVPNLQDKFPLDKTAAVDSDNDGYPDAFLGNYTAADSPTGLTKDAYPNDAACHALEQGDGVACNYAAVIPSYVADAVVGDNQGVVYLLSKANARVFRWSTVTGSEMSPLIIGAAPVSMTYSADHNRLYFGYTSGKVTYINLSGDARETTFTTVATRVGGVAAAGKYLLVQDYSGAWATHYLFDRNGVQTDSKEWNYFSRSYAWSPSQSRLYFFRDDTSPNDLMYETIDQDRGKIIASGDSPYHGTYRIFGPIRVSNNGARVLLGTGDVYSGSDLKVIKSFGASVADAQWLDDGSLLMLNSNGGNTTVVLYSQVLSALRHQLVAGTPVALLKTEAGVTVVTQVNGKPKVTLWTDKL